MLRTHPVIREVFKQTRVIRNAEVLIQAHRRKGAQRRLRRNQIVLVLRHRLDDSVDHLVRDLNVAKQ
jgi:hypothetical protein